MKNLMLILLSVTVTAMFVASAVLVGRGPEKTTACIEGTASTAEHLRALEKGPGCYISSWLERK